MSFPPSSKAMLPGFGFAPSAATTMANSSSARLEPLADPRRQLVDVERPLRHDDGVGSRRHPGVQRYPAGVPPHDLDDQHPLVGLGGGLQPVQRLGGVDSLVDLDDAVLQHAEPPASAEVIRPACWRPARWTPPGPQRLGDQPRGGRLAVGRRDQDDVQVLGEPGEEVEDRFSATRPPLPRPAARDAAATALPAVTASLARGVSGSELPCHQFSILLAYAPRLGPVGNVVVVSLSIHSHSRIPARAQGQAG
ncbi:hypothetical protein SGLAM104S_01724 [Streptomyces glaucescens]